MHVKWPQSITNLQRRTHPHTPGRYQKDPSPPNSFSRRFFFLCSLGDLWYLPRLCARSLKISILVGVGCYHQVCFRELHLFQRPQCTTWSALFMKCYLMNHMSHDNIAMKGKYSNMNVYTIEGAWTKSQPSYHPWILSRFFLPPILLVRLLCKCLAADGATL